MTTLIEAIWFEKFSVSTSCYRRPPSLHPQLMDSAAVVVAATTTKTTSSLLACKLSSQLSPVSQLSSPS